DPESLVWLETSFRQRVRLPGLAYEAEGDYRTGPGQRFRLEVRTRVGQARGTLVLVGDGRYLWRGTRVGDRPWAQVTRAAVGADGEKGDDGLNFSGVAPLLRHLRARMTWVKHEAGAGGSVTLTGVWTEESRRQALPEDGPWPAGLPTRCRLTL